MTEKKTAQLSFRLTLDEKNELEEIAEIMSTTPASIVRSLTSSFIKQKRELSDRIKWPPKYEYYPGLSSQDILIQKNADEISA